MKAQLFSVIVEKREDDGYIAFCPKLQGCEAKAKTYEEVINNIAEAIRLHVEGIVSYNEDIIVH
ncbi:type II toxin-antitoxin system HicB family antitoxin [Peptococcaceae bacterium]|nr:type II toxin-antitoxin system HicB family antitoxin [Peptococcaceae bacterium]